MQRILVVCAGNICRSPVAAAMLKQRFPNKQITSAGLGALVDGGVDTRMISLTERDGLDCSQHKARQITSAMLQEADLVLVMSESQRRALLQQHPTATGKIMRFGHWLKSEINNGGQGADIPDPYRKSPEFFELVYRQLQHAVDGWEIKL